MARRDIKEDAPWKIEYELQKETMIVLIICSIVTVVGIWFSLSTQPFFCSSCHQRQSVTMRLSSHKNKSCNFCHRQRGILGMAEQRLEVLRMLAWYPADVLLLSTTITASVRNESCLHCHADISEAVIERNAIKMSHREPEQQNYLCTDCHRGIAHKDRVVGLGQSSMTVCLNCHTGDQTSDCDKCHDEDIRHRPPPEGTVWRFTHGKNWRELHGLGTLTTCEACHQGGFYCKRCHGTDIPHPESWLNVHGEDAVKMPNSCAVCHKRSYCNSCHGLDMPHPTGTFLKTHSSTVKKVGSKVCMRCHSRESCEKCHIRHIHRGVDPAIIEEVRKGLGIAD